MKKLILVVGLVAAAVACGTGADMMGEILDSGVPDAGAQVPGVTTAKFVGYSAGAHQLAPQGRLGGLFNTYAVCQADFGAKARICTIGEVHSTLDLPAPPPGATDGAQAGAYVAETLPPSCWNYDSTNRRGTYVTPDGWVRGGADCLERRVLACCAFD